MGASRVLLAPEDYSRSWLGTHRMHHPTGTVTLVFTDVQGSTELWDQLGESFGQVLHQHNGIVRELIDSHHGYEVKTEGDSFMIAFGGAPDAARFALALQDAIRRTQWDVGSVDVRVRIGLHTGQPICQTDPTNGRMDYFGPAVNRAARISAAGHGGQILVSQSCLDAARHDLEDASAEIIDLGEHRFRGLSRSLQVWQIASAAYAGQRFPDLDSLNAIPSNLPELATSFVGRDEQWRELANLVTDGGGGRLLTITGPGGIGKTRLSLRVASEVLDQFEGGVWFCDLTEAWGADSVCAGVASAFSVPLPAGQNPIAGVGSILEFRKPLLMILDNFEQVVDCGGATVGKWMARFTHVRFMVTSRTLLGIAGEREYRLAPLDLPPLPEAEDVSACARLIDYDVVNLFVERAREARADFEPSAGDLRAIARICNELEGMPLAIELAAARVKLLGPSQIVDRLGQKFQLLRSNRRDLPSRQQTLTGAIDWSYDLLCEWERAALCQACVFRGGFFPEAGEQVIDLSDFDDAPPAIDAVQALLDHSLLTSAHTPHGTRLRMYMAIREYAQQKLEHRFASAERAGLDQRHAEYYVRYAQNWDSRRGSDQAVEAFDRLELDVENLFAVQDRALLTGDASVAAQSILALATTMAIRGLSAERIGRLEKALDAVRAADPPLRLLEAKLLTALCLACQDRGDWDRAAMIADEGVALSESIGAERERGSALIQRGEMQRLRGDLASALDSFLAAERAFRAIDDTPAVGRAVGGVGSVQWKMGRYDDAIASFSRAVDLFEGIHHRAGVARNVGGRGIVLAELHDFSGAIECYEQAESMHRMLGNRLQLAQTIGNKAIALYERGDDAAALDGLAEAEGINREIGNKANLARNIGIRGQVYERQGKLDDAMACFSQAEAMHRELGNRSGIASNIARRGRALLALDRDDQARLALEESCAIFEDIGEGTTRESFECLAALAVAQDRCERPDDAATTALRALEIADSTGLMHAAHDAPLMEQITLLQGIARD